MGMVTKKDLITTAVLILVFLGCIVLIKKSLTSYPDTSKPMPTANRDGYTK